VLLMSRLARLHAFFIGKGSVTDMGEQYPQLDRHSQSNIEGLYITGNVAGTADIKAALNAGYDLAHHIPTLPRGCQQSCDYAVAIIGAGPAGVNAALEFEKLNVPHILLEAESRFITLKRFEPQHEFFLAKTGPTRIKGDLWFGDCTAGELVARWEETLKDRRLNLHEHERVLDVKKTDAFEVVTTRGRYLCERVIVAVGKLVLLSKLDPVKLEPTRVRRAQVETTQIPVEFFKKIGVRLENTWNWKRWAYLAGVSALVAAFYMTKKLNPGIVTIAGGDLNGWYPFLYSAIVIVFGIQAIRRYRGRLQTSKYLSLIFFQVAFFCVIPELLLHNWRAYGLVYAWPLALGPSSWQGFLKDTSTFYFWWTLIVSFVALPVFVMFTGKQYCSWVCGCGGLAETLGDRWRHFSPKGPENVRRERAILWVLVCAVVATLAVGFGIDVRFGGLIGGAYNWVVDTFLIAIIPVALYPFLGGKVWCRYWCPTAGFMHLLSGWFTRRGIGRYKIDSNRRRCIACNLCSRYCEVGIDVRKFAVKGESFDNVLTSCIGCGICISVCPTEALAFAAGPLGAGTSRAIRATWEAMAASGHGSS
jgi:polyferredoxin